MRECRLFRSPTRPIPRRVSAVLTGLFAVVLVGAAAIAGPPRLALERTVDGWPAISASGVQTNEVLVLERTADPVAGPWQEWQRTHGPVASLADFTGSEGSSSFYRAFVRPAGATDDWKNLVQGDGTERFQSPPEPEWDPGVRWIKFALLLDQPDRVYFQDSTRYDFHYDFAIKRLPGFAGLGRSAFDAVTLRLSGQRAVLGAVLYPPSASVRELGIQFVGLDAYPRESIAAWFRTVRARIEAPPDVTVYYLPTFEQAETARRQKDWLEREHVPVSTAGRWVVGDECYAGGWALGRLVFVAGTEINEAYRTGRLVSDDILLTDAVPAEVPPLAGIVALAPSTPNSHVALLSQSFGNPFVHVADPSLAEAVRGWTNREVLVRATRTFAGCNLTVAPLDEPMPNAVRTNVLALRLPPPLPIPPKAAKGAITVPADTLHPADVRYVGGKAANFGVLRQQLPNASPSPALAIPFDLWDAYLDQPWRGGRSLRESIRDRLAGFGWPPALPALPTALAEIRDWITDDTDFTPAQKTALLAALRDAGFPVDRNIRFRSSTNVEDGETFSGAGLYDSYSGCLADDLDDDITGPSACDPTEVNERGVFRALRKVYASFYNSNAFLERLRHQVDETKAGMAVLVHPSLPDAFEMANGVATLRVSREADRYVSGSLVTQAGAVSVTNPDTTAVPETVSVSQFGATPFLSLDRRSSLVPLGGSVMTWDADYRALFALLNSAARGYEAEFPAKKLLNLDFEYKRLAPEGRLEVKQIREVPQPAERTYLPWLVDRTDTFEVFQGETGDVIAKHRLKSSWRLSVRTTRVDDAGLATTPLEHVEATTRLGTNVVHLSGAPGSFANYTYRRSAENFVDRWDQGAGSDRRRYELQFTRIPVTSSAEGPLLLLADHALELGVTYATPQPGLGYDPFSDTVKETRVTNETVRLTPVPSVTAASLRQDRNFKAGRVQVHTEFWWPPMPTGPTAGYTAPLVAWVQTTLTGLASRPIVLRHPWAQTYQPGHHNFHEDYVFEPRLDPDVPADLVGELDAAGIKAIVVGDPRGNFGQTTALIWGLDDHFRPL